MCDIYSIAMTHQEKLCEMEAAIRSDKLDAFEQVSESLIKIDDSTMSQPEYVGKLLHLAIDEENILFMCCRFGSIQILSYLMQQGHKYNVQCLKSSLLSTSNKHHSNSLLIASIARKRNNEQQQESKLSCLKMLMNAMNEMLSTNQFEKLINRADGNNFHVLEEAIQLLFEYCTFVDGKFVSHNRDHKDSEKFPEKNNMLQIEQRIFSFEFGNMKEIDVKIISFLSCKDGLSFRQINKYFNKLINDNSRLFDYFIFQSMKNSVNEIPTRANNIKNKIENNEKCKYSHVFISRCIKNKMFNNFLYILDKNTLVKRDDNSTICQFMNRLEARCKQFFDCVKIAKQNNNNGRIFCRKVSAEKGNKTCEQVQVLKKKHQEMASKCTSLHTRRYINDFIIHLYHIITNVAKLDKKLFKNETHHFQAFKKIHNCYD